MRSLLSSAFLLAFLHSLGAVEIAGFVQSGNDKNATIRVEGELVPTTGDKAEIFFKLPGAEDEISVATGSVTKVNGGSIELKIENATGEIAKDQLVRITSEKPQKRETAASAPAPGRDPSLAFAAMAQIFASSDKTKAAEAEINAARNNAKAELDRRTAARESGLAEWRAQQEKELGEKAAQVRSTLVADLVATVKQAGDDSSNLIIDSSGRSTNDLPLFFVTPLPAQEAKAVKGGRGFKVALFDLQAVFRDFRKTKEAETEINAARSSAKSEFDRRTASKQSGLAEWRAAKEKELAESAQQKRSAIVAEITAKIRAIFPSDDRFIAIDSSATSTAKTPLVLYHSGVPEFAAEVAEALNSSSARAPSTAPMASTNLRIGVVDLPQLAPADVNGKILPAVREIGARDGYNLIFDRTGESYNKLPFFISTRDLPDLTDEIAARIK